MARTAVVGSSGGGGLVSKVVSTLVLLGVIVFVVKHPQQAADLTLTLLGWGKTAVEGISAFIQRVS